MRAATKPQARARQIEQRAEPRYSSRGEIWFRFDETGCIKGRSREIRGTLLDRSAGGFRAEHDCPELTSGQVVRFRLTTSVKGQARVVWTRILEGRVETGFLIL